MGIKLAHIVPPSFGDLYRTGYYLALGQKLLSDRGYREQTLRLSKAGGFVIVDNGAAEFDQPPFADVAQVAAYVRAAEVVMPDVLFDKEATIANVTALKNRNLVPPEQRLIIPQGNTIAEWFECLAFLKEAVAFGTLGIPKHLEKHEGGRAKVMNELPATAQRIHFFGVYQDHKTEIPTAVAAKVRGLDSGAAVAYAQANMRLDSGIHVSLNWDARPGPQERTEAFKNIMQMEDWANG